MSGVATPYLAEVLLAVQFQGSGRPFNQVEFALTTRIPVSNAGLANLTEPIGGGYRRSNPVPLDASNWQFNGSRQLYNVLPIGWPLDCTVSWGTIFGWAMVSLGSNPQVLALGELNTPTRFLPGMRPRLPGGSVTLQLDVT